MKTQKIEFTRVKNDTNGNPRFVCHFLNLLTAEDKNGSITGQYQKALSNSRQFGGRKFHNKQYGGGIVFQSYNLGDLERSILTFVNK